jgi:hypothetical protein
MHSYTDFPPPWSAIWDFQQPKDTQQRLLDHLSETAADSTVAYQIEVQTQVARNPTDGRARQLYDRRQHNYNHNQ